MNVLHPDFGGLAGRNDYYLIFGFSITEAGRICQAMERRVSAALNAAALAAAADRERSVFLATGGVGRFPPSEASLMARMLEDHGVRPTRILKEENSRTTLDSVIHCAAFLKGLTALGEVVVCTDHYHQFRCRLLLRLLGVRTRPSKIASGLRSSGPWLWGYYYLREFPALLYNLLLLGPMLAWFNLRNGSVAV